MLSQGPVRPGGREPRHGLALVVGDSSRPGAAASAPELVMRSGVRGLYDQGWRAAESPPWSQRASTAPLDGDEDLGEICPSCPPGT